MRMARFAFRGGAEHGRHVVEAFDVGLGCEIEVTTIRLGFAGEGVFQILFGLAAFEIHCRLLLIELRTGARHERRQKRVSPEIPQAGREYAAR
jgi:hypothetical protein